VEHRRSMETREPAGAKAGAAPTVGDAVPEPYAGEAGQTRREPVHVLVSGSVRSTEVVTALNVATDPALRDAALAGTLHRIEGIGELAHAFVYHDPSARKLVLVVPDVLRHTALRERARLLDRIAADTKHAVPDYVRDANVVVGVRELKAYLALRDGTPKTAAASTPAAASAAGTSADHARREADLRAREEQFAIREERLSKRAEGVTSREDELATRAEELEATQREVTLKEQELEARLEALQAREASIAPAAEASASPTNRPTSVVTRPGADAIGAPVISKLISDSPTNGSSSQIGGESVEELADENEVEEEIDDLSDMMVVTGVGPAPTAPDGRASLVTIEDTTSTIAGRTRAPTHQEITRRSAATGPARLLAGGEVEMVASFEDGEVHLYARLDEGREQAFQSKDVDLLEQLVLVQGYPVVLLSLVEDHADRPYVRRAALDPHDGSDRKVLDALRRSFHAMVDLHGSDASFLTTIAVAAPREVNAGLVLDRVTRLGADTAIDATTAIERALAAPPPVREAGHPYAAADEAEPATAAQALRMLERVAAWHTAEKLDHALLVLSIPRDVVDVAIRRTLEAAVRFGLALGGTLRTHAVSLGVANEPTEIVARQLTSFRRVSSSPDHGGLTIEQVGANWEKLLREAGECELAIESDLHEAAWEAIRATRADLTGPHAAAIDVDRIAEMGSPELVMLLEHPRARRLAALELCKRGDPEYIDPIYRTVRKMPRPDVVRIVPKVALFGESAGDVLIDGLTARKTFVRQASALALGHLKLRRAIVPLQHALHAESSEVWRELARVIGEFGMASFRSVARALKDPKIDEERFAHTLAHLANYGCLRNIEKLAEDEDPKTFRIAREGLTLREELLVIDRAVRGDRDLMTEDPVLRFSRRFYEEMAGTAPEADLTDATDAEG